MKSLKHRNVLMGVGLAVLGFAAPFASSAQTPPAAAPAAPTAPAAPAVPPNYVSIPLEIVVNKPVADVWARIGKYCDIGEWLQLACTITSGKDGEVGTVRSIGTE